MTPCIAAIVFSLACSLPRPDAPEPAFFHHGPATNRAIYSGFVTPLPEIGPILAQRPAVERRKASDGRRAVRTREATQRPVEMVSAYVAPRGLEKLAPKAAGGKIFTLSDGNEKTGCLPKNRKLWSAMKKIRAHYGRPLEIESAYRSPAYNAALRKRSKRVAKNSYHTRCAAIDMRIRGVSMRALAKFASTLPEVGGIGLYSTWIHIDVRARRNGRIARW